MVDEANLARGLAIEQTAQAIRSALYGAMGLLGINYLSDEAVEAVESRIRSLDPDATKALAAHDAERDKRWIESLTNGGEGGTALTDHFKQAVAEIERRTRLNGQIFEAKRQSHNWYGWYIHPYQDDCRDCKHIKELEVERAALAESQPAPATQENVNAKE